MIWKQNNESETMKWKMKNVNDEMKGTDNNIGAEGARMISEALKINTTLTTLDLCCDDNE